MIKRVLRYNFSLLNTDHVALGPQWNYQNVISPYHRIYYIDKGEGEISDINTMHRLEPGYLYIIPSFTLCNMVCQSYLSQYFVQFFEDSSDGISIFSDSRAIFKIAANEIDVTNFKRLVDINPGRGINRSNNPKIYEKNIFYKEYQQLNNLQNVSSFFETQGILLQLISRFVVPEVLKQKDIRPIPVKILDAISFISLNLHRQLPIIFLAERARQHPDYFSKIFEQFTGTRPAAYIIEKRIERAQYLIVTGSAPYSEIAESTGFESLAHFSKTFKRITGLSPSTYKKQIYQVV